MARLMNLPILLQLSVLHIGVHWCIYMKAAGTVQVFPSSYTILSPAVYEDRACSPVSSRHRSPSNAVVTCFRRQSGVTPKLNDSVLGPENELRSPTTDVAYTISGTTATYERWISFEFVSLVSLSHVTLHYFGTLSQLRLVTENTARRQSLTFNISTNTRKVDLTVQGNGGLFYLTEVQFFADAVSVPTPVLTTTPATTTQPVNPHSATPISASCVCKNSIVRASSTVLCQEPMTSKRTSDAVAKMGWIVAGVSALINGVLVITMIVYCWNMRRVRHGNTLHCKNNLAYDIPQSRPFPHLENISSLQHLAEDSNEPEPAIPGEPVNTNILHQI